MADAHETSVLVVGAGPVGLTLAIDLAQRGVDVLIAESRARGEPPPPKCNHVAARSMEIFRRLGVVGALRDAGLPADYPNDIAYRTTFTGMELTRIPIPCRRDRYTSREGPDTWWPTPEPPHRINQIFLEPILFAQAEARRGIAIRCRSEITGYTEDADGITAHGRDLDNGAPIRIRCQYLVGCEGGRSPTRRAIGAAFQGEAVVQRVQSTFIRAPVLRSLQHHPPAWATFSLNPRRSGNVYAIDGLERWLIHNYLREDEADFESVDRDWAIRTILGVGGDFQYEILSKEDWFGRRLVADRFRRGRAFLCGDSAHVWVPYAGYGMNAGIADAATLAWLLAAHLNGWAPAAILDAYERERLPITEQVSHFAMNHAHAMAKQRRGVSAEIERADSAGAAARAALGKAAYDLNVQQYCAAGLNFGSYYEASPLIAYDGEAAPPYGMGSFTASTVPGCRVPHLWLSGGRSLYDVLGGDYAIVRLDRSADAEPLLAAARHRRMPMNLVDVTAAEAGDAPYRHKLVIARPDQHVGWRGDAAPADPLALINRLRGAA